ncbi:MAG: hypothetical protein J0I47_08765 [Sphingomonas sp.]|uniref:hypothetical protein n=1 Tax=Sphingomonas sp. TaxID=28214 RepID=UPI001AD2CB46|nr:hypothetical protein [Sphingomonas sp.]MBN8808312.1 hypothetical protein [Sphingomonas sp.]
MIAISLMAALAAGQTAAPVPVAVTPIVTVPVVASAAIVPVKPTIVTIPTDTPVELMAVTEVTTANVHAGSRFKLRVNRAIEVDGRVVVPVGAWAWGEITSARDAGGLGKSGQMTGHLLYLQVGEAQVPLEGDVKAKGTGAGSAGAAVLMAGVLGLFARGNNAKIKAGEIVMGFVSAPVALEMAGPVPHAVDAVADRSAVK